jgi:hypothetical protein
MNINAITRWVMHGHDKVGHIAKTIGDRHRYVIKCKIHMIQCINLVCSG